MPSGQGILAIRDADRTQVLASPTTISGTVDDETGVISNTTLSTPPLEFDTVALGFPVHVTANFVQVAPGTGLVSATPGAPEGEGTVNLRSVVDVNLTLEIGDPLIIEANCVAENVNLDLRSTTAYTEVGGGTVADTNFTVPSVQSNDTDCIAQVADGVNGLLEGPGHSLSVRIQGDLPVPPLKAETATTLSVDPSEGSLRGTPVTLTATVEDVESVPEDPTGLVVFKDGAQTLGTGEVQPDGTATLTTTALRPGSRSLTAEYGGDAEFGPSQSAAVPYEVAPSPILTGTFPEYITRGAGPVEFDLEIDNAGSARPIANGRVDITLPGLNVGNFVLERQLPDSTWVPVPLSFSLTTQGVVGTLGPDDGVVISAGAVENVHLRVSAANSAPIRAGEINLSLVTVDPGTGVDGPTVAASSWPYNIVLPARTATTTFVGVYDAALRPGQQLYVDASVTEVGTGFYATTGMVEFLIDGVVMPFRPFQGFGPLLPLTTRAAVDANGYAAARVNLPADLSTGSHVVTARYLGDASYRPSNSQEHVLAINDPLGPVYKCDWVTVTAVELGAFVQGYVRLPAYAEDGEELDLEDLEITLTAGGIDTPGTLGLLTTAGGFGVNDIEIDLGGAGTIVGTGVDYEANYSSADQFLYLQGLEGSIIVDGEPGDMMPLPIERIEMSGIELTLESQFTFTCLPQGEPTILDEVGVAGVALTAETTTDPVRTGDDVVLTAKAAPAGPTGQIEFFAGSQSLGTASGASGTATLTVDDLPAGTNLLTARYVGVTGSPYRSDVVELGVLPAIDCATFAEPGNAAVVRLVYIELLGRCPDPAGFDYWVGRLDGGTSPSVFARSIARTPEAVGRVVDDAYRTMLGRAADASGRAFWVGRMRAGSGRYDQLLADLAASPEFWALSGSTRVGFVTRVYERLLNRAPEPAGLEFWTDRLAAGASRRALVLSLANTPEPLGRLVVASYDEILGRAPGGSEQSTGTSYLRGTGDRSGLYAELIGSPEFATRADGFPNPED